MLISALAVFLPPSLTNSPKHASTQLLAPLQDLARLLTSFGSRPSTSLAPRAEPDPAIMHELASKTMLNEQLRADLERMQGIRDLSIPAALQAHVVAWDIVSTRDSAVIERGNELKVSESDWVTSHVFLDRGDAAVRSGQAVISREVLLGRVDFVSPYMSRVKLFSDIDAKPIKVRFEAIREGESRVVDVPCTMRGLGRGQMIVRDVHYEYIEAASDALDGKTRIRVGDYVTSEPNQLGLPVPLVVGHVVEIRHDPKQRLVYDVIIEPTVNRDDIRYIHVIPLIPNAVAMD